MEKLATRTLDNVSNVPFLKLLSKTHVATFITPLKYINEGHDVSIFLVSKAYGDIVTFILQLNRAMFPSYIQDVSTSGQNRIQTWDLGCQAVDFSETVQNLRQLLGRLDRIIDEVPPDPGPRRFGNASFKKWYQTVEDRTSDLLKSYLSESTLRYPHESEVTAEAELSSYFLGSFGSSQRLDYGSGHELSFLAFLGCIWKLGGFSSPDERSSPGNEERAIVLGLIVPYLSLIRRLILNYTLEPAGSHGVWGLDDHSFIPYIFGSAQYGPAISPSDQTPIEGSRTDAPDPADVAKAPTVETQRHQNMYFDAIGFIHDVKKGPFWEHSPMLYDISGIRAGWGKINKGMIKMYNAEVLSKFPVVQHFRFGSLFSFDRDPDAVPPPTSAHAANQPIRDGLGSLEAEKIAASRAPPPQLGTQAPYANQATSVPGTGAEVPWTRKAPPRPNLADAAVGTAAPWASRQPAGPRVALPPTRFPPSGSRPMPADVNRAIPTEEDAKDGDAAARSMPPPTRAPWAKPP